MVQVCRNARSKLRPPSPWQLMPGPARVSFHTGTLLPQPGTVTINALNKNMKLIISGSRTVQDKAKVFATLDAFTARTKPTEVVCGCASGPDLIGKAWAKKNNIPVKEFPAAWTDLDVAGARIKTRPDGTKYNQMAGLFRNLAMGEYADAAICFWD